MAGARYARMMDPHRLLQYAKTKGLGNELFRRAQELLFEEGVLLSDHRVLLRVAREVGLDEAEARAVLDSDRFHQEVLADDGIAREMVIDYVPYYVVDGKHHFSGDLNLQDYLDNLKKAANQLIRRRPMLEFKFDVQTLIEGTDLDEDKITEYFTNNFEGDCLLAVGDEELIKIHFHTNKPWEVLEYCASLGEIYDIMVENMERQAEEFE